MSIGKRLYEARKNAGLSQEDVVEKLNVARQTISKWELDETIPDLKQGEALLLSPASASFNEFKNYIERGKCFKKYVEEYYEKKR